MIPVIVRLSQKTFDTLGADKRKQFGDGLSEFLTRQLGWSHIGTAHVYWHSWQDVQGDVDLVLEVMFNDSFSMAEKLSMGLCVHMKHSPQLSPEWIVGVSFPLLPGIAYRDEIVATRAV